MDGPVYKRAYAPWDRAPGEEIIAALRIAWLETAIGVLRLNCTQEAQDAAAHQADAMIARLEATGNPLMALYGALASESQVAGKGGTRHSGQGTGGT